MSWVEFHAPFNPRGDGYQDLGCSSAGKATAVSAYDWVNIALETDSEFVVWTLHPEAALTSGQRLVV